MEQDNEFYLAFILFPNSGGNLSILRFNGKSPLPLIYGSLAFLRTKCNIK